MAKNFIVSRSREIAAAPERGPELERALLEAEDARKAADAEVERLAGTLAAVEARANAESARKRDAEARLAREIVDSAQLSEAADRIGVSLNTAKTQLRSVFAKTRTRRQADLVALL